MCVHLHVPVVDNRKTEKSAGPRTIIEIGILLLGFNDARRFPTNGSGRSIFAILNNTILKCGTVRPNRRAHGRSCGPSPEEGRRLPAVPRSFIRLFDSKNYHRGPPEVAVPVNARAGRGLFTNFHMFHPPPPRLASRHRLDRGSTNYFRPDCVAFRTRADPSDERAQSTPKHRSKT